LGRKYPNHPVVGVGAIILRGDEVLVVRRGAPPQAGLWSIPGGAVELGEGLQEALIREIAEETGVTVEILGLATALDRIYLDLHGRVEYHYVLLDYCCTYRSGEPRADSDVLEARWVHLKHLEPLEMTEGTLEVIRDAANRYGKPLLALGQSP
jgi:ADP-ribose pyrophosphatase YjhB (NUDIX family)